MTKTVLMLIGPKGSGKTYIGTVLERQIGTTFLRVEPIWLNLAKGEDGWAVVESHIDRYLYQADTVVIESLGGSQGFERLRANLSQKYSVKYVRIVVPLDVCAKRVRNRDSSNHIPVSDEKVDEYNRIAAQVVLPWDLELTNDPILPDDIILDMMSSIQQGAQPDAFGAG